MKFTSFGKYQKKLWLLLFALFLAFSVILSLTSFANAVERKKEAASIAFQEVLSDKYQSLNDQLLTAFYSVMYISQSDAMMAMSLDDDLTTTELYYLTIKAQAEIGKFTALYAMPEGSSISAFYLKNNNGLAFDDTGSEDIATYCNKIGQTQPNLNKIVYEITQNQLENNLMKLATIDSTTVLQYYFRAGGKNSNAVVLLQIPTQTLSAIFHFEEYETLNVNWILSDTNKIFIQKGDFDASIALFELAESLPITTSLSSAYQDDTTTILSGAFETTPLHFSISYQTTAALRSADYLQYVGNFILALLASILLSWILAQILYRPVINMLKLLNIDVPKRGQDEFNQIATAHQQMLSDVDALNDQLNYQQFLLHSQQIGDCLLHAHPRTEDTTLDRNADYFVTVFTYPSQTHPHATFAKTRLFFKDAASTQKAPIYLAYTTFSSFALVFVGTTPDAASKWITDQANMLPKDADCALKIAISPLSGDLATLNKQYLECVNILEFKNRFFENLILTKDMLPADAAEMFSYSFDQEQDFIQLISSGSKDAFTLLQNILKDNFENQALRITEYHDLFFALLFTFRHIIYINQIDIALPSYETILSTTRKRDLKLLAQSLLVLTEEMLKQVNQNKSANNASTAQKIDHYIALHYHQDISLDDLATELNMSKKYCSSLFKKSTGNTFKKQLNAYRIEMSKNVLRTQPKTKISDLALMVGFASANTFIQVFKQYVGITPSKYASNPDSAPTKLLAP